MYSCKRFGPHRLKFVSIYLYKVKENKGIRKLGKTINQTHFQSVSRHLLGHTHAKTVLNGHGLQLPAGLFMYCVLFSQP